MQATLQIFFQSIVDHKIVADADSKLTASLYIISKQKTTEKYPNSKFEEFSF